MSSAGAASARTGYPLTALQRAMVLASVRAPGSGVYILQRMCESREPLDRALLERAWNRVMIRHAALRCRIVREGGDDFALRVEDAPRVEWRFHENLSAADFLNIDRERGFRFEDGVPMRFALWHTGQGSTLLWTVHHALLDGRSVVLVWRELFAIYDALAGGEQVILPPAPDMRAHLDWLARRDFPSSEPYWRKLWDGVSDTTGFPEDRLHSAAPAAGDAVAREIRQTEVEFTSELEALAARMGVTVNTVVLGAWALLASRYSGREDVIFGVARHCRASSVADAAAMVGPLMNTLPFRVHVDADQPVDAWLRQIRARWMELGEHEHTPLDRVRTWSSLPPGMPPFESVVVYDHQTVSQTLRHPSRCFRGQERTDVALTLAAWGRPRLTLQIVYDTGRYCRETVAGMLAQFEELLRGFVSQPGGRVGAGNLLNSRERERLTVEWNSAARTSARDICAHRLFEEQARKTPHRSALEDGSAISYADANRRANQLARLLRKRGVGPEDIVAVKLPASAPAVLAMLATLKAGGAFLPLDPSQPAERLAGMIARAAPKCIVDDWAALESEMSACDDGDLPPAAGPDNAAYAIYTSGSTGTPKAVVMTHRSLVNHSLAMARLQGIGEGDRRLQFASMGSDVMVAEIFNYLTCGATLVFGREQAAGSMAAFLRVLEEKSITVTGIPSAWWREWVAAMDAGSAALPRSLRIVNTGMERVDAAAYRHWKRLVGTRVRWFNVYGPTETLTALCYEAGTSAWEGGNFVPIGRPIANACAYALDGRGDPAPVGVAGELFIGGAGVARGYLGDDELTASRFLADAFSGVTGAKLYRTGDLVFALPDGNFVFLGRADRQLKIRGYRIDPDEVEAALAQMAAVRHCAVIASPEGQLVAYVAWSEGAAAPGLEEVRRHMAGRLPAYMVPQGFLVVDEMPFTASGKIDRQRLPAGAERLLPDGTYRAPATAMEQRVAELWQRTLGIPRVSLDDDFFELGGDSLRATALIMALAREFGREFSASALRQSPTVAKMAAELESGSPALTVYRPQGSRMPIFAVASAPDDAICFAALASQLGDDWPFIALASPVEEQPLPMAELAARVCRLVRTVRPEGPYVLAGYCFGGLVAFEAARQLRASGADVRLVALFDTIRPAHPRFLGASSSQWRRRLVRAGLLAPLRVVGARAEATVAAARTYAPAAIDVPVAQFLTRTHMLLWRALGDPRLAWRDLCGAGFHVHELPGPHGHPFFERHCESIATGLNRILDSGQITH